jgi:signal transduction protein with GAF and PtsI domain
MHLPAAIRHLHAVAEKGEAPETPVILIGELLVFLIPIAVVLLAIGFGLYYAFGGS